MKVCTQCKLEKSLDCFSKKNRNKDGLQIECKDCHSVYLKTHYQNNKEYYKTKAVESKAPKRIENLQFTINYLKEHPCVDCGESDPIVLEFDHLRDKYKGVSNLVTSGASLNLIKQEIEKCEVRCCNCHRRKTAIQLGWYKDIEI